MNTEQELAQISALLGDQNTSAASEQKDAASEQNTTAAPTANALASVAIIGVAAKLPGCDSVDAFWQALANEESLISAFPDDRFNWQEAVSQYDSELADDAPQYGGMLNGVFDFDAEFFGVSPDAAPLIDPRQRLLLHSIYHCFEDAGCAPQSLKRSATGVFIGAEDSEYQITLQQNGIFPDVTATSAMLANNIAYWFDFCGASEVVNTLCSSGAVALHRAVQALRSGELQQAVVAGVNLLLRPESYVGLTQMGQLSPSPEIYSFGAKADGFIRSEGVVSLLLKPLQQAEQDGNHIYAQIKNTAVNFNGQGGMSMASPNVAAHVDVIKQCYEPANINLQQLRYIEAQGMGTTVSDIAEWSAFNKAMRQLARAKNTTVENGQVAIGTLKPTLGHMHAASSLGALLKVVGSMRSGKLYGIAHFDQPSPDLDLDDSPCRLLASSEDWPGSLLNASVTEPLTQPLTQPYLAAVHSYGIGGNNAHILLESYQATASAKASAKENAKSKASNPSVHFLPVSAPTDAQLRLCLNQLADFLNEHAVTLDSLERTLKQGRDSFAHRVLIAVSGDHSSIVTAEQTNSAIAKAINHYLLQGAQTNPAALNLDYAVNVLDDASQLNALTASGDESDNPAGSAESAQQWLSAKSANSAKSESWSLSKEVKAAPICRLPLFPFSTQSYRISATQAPQQQAEPAGESLKFAALAAEPGRTQAQAVTLYIQQFLARSMHAAEPIAPDTPFVDSGVDSLIMVRLVRAIEKEMAVKLSGRDFMQCADIASLSALIAQRMGVAEKPAHSASSSANPSNAANPASSSDLDLEALNKFKSGEMSLDDIKKLVK